MTADFEAARRVVDRVVTDTGGLVGKVTISRTRGDARSLSATLLIPASRLDAALPSLKAIGLVLEEFQGGDDVTEQVVDVEARLTNARNTEKRLVELLQKRTGDLADVLAAEREISRVREEIERHDAQRKNLERRVAYATLILEVTEEQHAAVDSRASAGIRHVPRRVRDRRLRRARQRARLRPVPRARGTNTGGLDRRGRRAGMARMDRPAVETRGGVERRL